MVLVNYPFWTGFSNLFEFWKISISIFEFENVSTKELKMWESKFLSIMVGYISSEDLMELYTIKTSKMISLIHEL